MTKVRHLAHRRHLRHRKPTSCNTHRSRILTGRDRAGCDEESFHQVGVLKRIAYILLAVALLQVSGLRVFCARGMWSGHDCCPPVEKSQAPKAAPFSKCCVVAAIRYQESTAQALTRNDLVGAAVDAALVETGHTTPTLAVNTLLTHAVSPPISPPLNPLHQTCLLLI
jgi:hypothetical protein